MSYIHFFSSAIVSRLLFFSFMHDCLRADNHSYVPLYKYHNKSPALGWDTRTIAPIARAPWTLANSFACCVSSVLLYCMAVLLWYDSWPTIEEVRFLVFLTFSDLSWKDWPNFVSLKFLPRLTIAIFCYLIAISFFNRNLPLHYLDNLMHFHPRLSISKITRNGGGGGCVFT